MLASCTSNQCHTRRHSRVDTSTGKAYHPPRTAYAVTHAAPPNGRQRRALERHDDRRRRALGGDGGARRPLFSPLYIMFMNILVLVRLGHRRSSASVGGSVLFTKITTSLGREREIRLRMIDSHRAHLVRSAACSRSGSSSAGCRESAARARRSPGCSAKLVRADLRGLGRAYSYPVVAL